MLERRRGRFLARLRDAIEEELEIRAADGWSGHLFALRRLSVIGRLRRTSFGQPLRRVVHSL